MSFMHKTVIDALTRRVALIRGRTAKDAESASDAERASGRP